MSLDQTIQVLKTIYALYVNALFSGNAIGCIVVPSGITQCALIGLMAYSIGLDTQTFWNEMHGCVLPPFEQMEDELRHGVVL